MPGNFKFGKPCWCALAAEPIRRTSSTKAVCHHGAMGFRMLPTVAVTGVEDIGFAERSGIELHGELIADLCETGAAELNELELQTCTQVHASYAQSANEQDFRTTLVTSP